MVASRVEFIVNEKGERTRAVIDIELYERMLEELEMAEDVRAYDEAVKDAGHALPLREAVEEIERLAE